MGSVTSKAPATSRAPIGSNPALGHEDPGSTLRVYGHLMPGTGDRAREAIDASWARRVPLVGQGGA
jgi:hypothetical protein